jgi:molybdenum cofactor synthesis domain-containing protein
MKVEIVAIGNELLIGKTLNTNASWLAKRITFLGLTVTRITVIRDDVSGIATLLREILARDPTFIIITGGLGPTFDDRTFEGISEAINSPLNVDAKAITMIREKYIRYAQKLGREKFKLTPARVKMATIPTRAEPLPNPVGTAPGICIHYENSIIYALPGVPSEMKAIFEESIIPVLRETAGNLSFYESSLLVTGIMESELAPLIDQVMRDTSHIYIKSHPLGAEDTPKIELHITMATTKQTEFARARVEKASTQLIGIIQAHGGKILTTRQLEQIAETFFPSYNI